MPFDFAIVGFRHGHIMDLVQRLKNNPLARLSAASEDHPATRQALLDQGTVPLQYQDLAQMLAQASCQVVGVGDYFSRRGQLIIQALQAGKHVISDKPLCTSLEELQQIEQLVRQKGLSLGCQLDLRDAAVFRTLRQICRSGELGEVHAISFGGQHPLMYGSRAGWYFEPGKHGGTINDIAIHGLDAIPWLTGLSFARVEAARAWNGRLKQVPHFQDCGQLMMSLSNGCGVLGDVSYLAPDSFGYGMPQYWRVTLWGSEGVAECGYNNSTITVYAQGQKQPRQVPAQGANPGGYLQAFLREISGEKPQDGELTTAEVIQSQRVALLAQQAADQGLCHLPC